MLSKQQKLLLAQLDGKGVQNDSFGAIFFDSDEEGKTRGLAVSHVAALMRSHTNGSIDRTIEQTTKQGSHTLKQ